MDTKNRSTYVVVVGMFFLFINTQAQMHNKGNLFVGADATLYLENGHFNVGPLAVTTTIKPDLPDGIGALSFGSAATIFSGTNTQFVDGWVSTLGTNTFRFPIGQTDLVTRYYAPAEATPVAGSTGVSAAYFRDNTSTIGAVTDVNLTSISALEYWKIRGSNATLSLTWNISSAIVTPELGRITVIGYDNATSKWVEIYSSVDETSILGGTSTTTSGSVTTTAPIVLANYSAFSIGIKTTNCPQLIYGAGNSVTYSGTFSTTPTFADVVTINSSGATGSFVCNSLVLNADITLSGTQSIEVVNGITGVGKIIMSSQSSLVQRATGAEVARPTIELTKATRNTMHQFDYVYWGAPIGGDVFSQLSEAKASTANLADAFDFKYKYVSGTGGGWQTLTATETGKGFITRVRAQAPFVSSVDTDYINFKFSGTANNGDITVPITNNLLNLNGGTSHNLLANPYPSALDADKFLQENTNIDGVIYIWKQTSPSFGTFTPYGQADYIAYTRAGTTASSNVSTEPFLGKIASGQGFKVKALGAGTVTFTNCMRLTNQNTNFNKFTEAVRVMDRYKVNMIGTNSVFSQIVVSYLPEGTLGYDRMYDAGRNSVSTAQLYSILETDGGKLAINARPDFDPTDVVKLGVSKTGTTDESFTLSIQEKEGVFAAATPVYVHDLVLNSYTDLTLSDYTFSSNTALLNNRFEIVYQAALSNTEFENTNIIAFITNGELSVTSSLEMKSIALYDILGRKIITILADGLKTKNSLFPFPKGIYIAKITHENGVVVSKKLINNN